MAHDHSVVVGAVIPAVNNEDNAVHLAFSLIGGIEPVTCRVVVVVSGTTGTSVSGQRLLAEGRIKVVYSTMVLPASAARNRGVAELWGDEDYVLFIDDDNDMRAESVNSLIRYLSEHASCVAVGPWQYDWTNRGQLMTAGCMHLKSGRTRVVKETSDSTVICDAISNVFLVRKAQLEGVGGFDCRVFPMHFEESDLQWRLATCYGGYIATVRSAAVFHRFRAGVLQQLLPKSQSRAYMLGRNRGCYYARRYGVPRACLALVVTQLPVSAVTVVMMLYEVMRRRLPPSLIVAHVKGLLDSVRCAIEQGKYRDDVVVDGIGRGGKSESWWLEHWS